jgi:hypothetical protein
MSQPTRRAVLAHLLAGPLVVAAPAALAAPAPTPRRRVRIQETHVAGLDYYDVLAHQHTLAPGAPLTLRREPENPHDANAIEVLTPSGAKLGYVPRHRNAPIAALMDAEVAAAAEVVSVGSYWNRLDVRFAVSVEV